MSGWHVDWHRVGRRVVVVGVIGLAAIQLYFSARGSHYGLDFHGGTWKAGQDVLAGRSPYPQPNAGKLLTLTSAFITPPILALLAIPLSVLPFTLAVVLWNAVCAGAFVVALLLLGVRDRRLYLLALCSFPFVASLVLGQPDGLFALGAAVAWRWRDSWRGAAAVGALIAAKLLAWPLVLWLVATRRIRYSGIALASSAMFLTTSWALIGFKGLRDYPRLLTADATAFETRSHSVVSGAMRLGASEQSARWLAIACAAVIALAVLRMARGSDEGYFAAAVAGGLLASPILWSHYLVVLFVPLSICRRRLDGIWLLTAGFWLSPVENPNGWELGLALVITFVITIMAPSVARPRPAPVRFVG